MASSAPAADLQLWIEADKLSRRQFWRKIQLALVVIISVLLIGLSRPLFPDEHVVRAAMAGVGIIAATVAVFIRLWSALYIGGRKKRELVTAGPYAVMRNPLYLATIGGIFGMGLVFGSFAVAFGASLVCFLIFDRIVRSEECFLRQSFGEAYELYCAETPRWRPRLWRIGFQGYVDVDVAVTLRTMREALIFFVVLGMQPLLTMFDESGALPNLFILP